MKEIIASRFKGHLIYIIFQGCFIGYFLYSENVFTNILCIIM